ncbi:ZYRO0F13772p [Zygosaccharomyces rouxii]|uniref:Ribosomal lysine N-methyltransferase 5 n=1 Tax=Zygosaccharomyces rouxii (strain ATCC 2623 / CBS 732 / NBRC 1130 / NCYC 568 / NRRL Y-229) TaxID=559307 RepID=RKM5_ZYGRC|nr:uncharacterized protein ZYRO0F13772g [Zygosaccharomyces rouxii]C5DYK5.1 RecName: Full=Ribosomal lysine N-methyltransferase 5 [Zygosaccharomyces rouxii CBS 732]KAH9199623.1 ribosomal N-lysine methyltransferase 5 [Zygosaccharomyces rouxii]CAR28866.1 ZYRO0F13772p [Zygosaccharomyces rouxii]
MVFHLKPFDVDNIHEHIFDRYTLLESLADGLSQDLGIHQRDEIVQVDIEPPITTKVKGKRKASKGLQPYNFTIRQSIAGLNSSSNANSTTGYVLWSTTPTFARWLLYDGNALPLREEDTDTSIPAIFSGSKSTAVVELGSGISGILPIVLGDQVDHYVCTDQKGILSKLKYNIEENLLQFNRRRCISEFLQIEPPSNEDQQRRNTRLEIMELDWEKFNGPTAQTHLTRISEECSTVHIVAMDVIYNDFLIDPFLKTLNHLRNYYLNEGLITHCIVGIHLRAQDVVEAFLERAILEYNLPICSVEDPFLEKTRVSLYYI